MQRISVMHILDTSVVIQIGLIITEGATIIKTALTITTIMIQKKLVASVDQEGIDRVFDNPHVHNTHTSISQPHSNSTAQTDCLCVIC